MSNTLSIQYSQSDALGQDDLALIPSEDKIESSLSLALTTIFPNKSKHVELNIKWVDADESAYLNGTYRGKDKPTNVLSFESDLPEFVESDFIGDLAICMTLVREESEQQNKSYSSHLTHLCIHGLLHLLGYDHITDNDAADMEAKEIEILAQLGIDDPYQSS